MRHYKCLKNQRFKHNEFSLIPLRDEDQLLIMKWRNEQIYHLRQAKPLTETDQKNYFDNVVSKLFEQEKPSQLLFSFLENGTCIGYGGLVHINWIDQNAEISFIMDTALEKDFFEYNWSNYLSLIKKVAFEEINFHKIFTYAFDLRPNLYPILLKNDFVEEARLKEHCYFEGQFIDVLIHSKVNLKRNEHNPNYGNVLITSISKKIPLLKSVKEGISKISYSIKIIGGDFNEKCLGKYFVDEFWKMPSLNLLSIETLIQICQEKNITLIIPTRDGELTFFAKNKKKLKEVGIHVMVSNEDDVEKCIDKLKFSQLDKLIIPSFKNIGDTNFEKYVVKEQYGAGSQSIGIKLNYEEAIEHAQKLENPIFQPYIDGYEISIDAYIDSKQTIKGIILRKREVVVSGESQITTTIENPVLEHQFYQIVKSLNLYGHIILQAIIDANNNIHVIECNPRFGGASTLALKAGLDSFYWVYLESMNVKLENYPFSKATKSITQVRFPNDLYL